MACPRGWREGQELDIIRSLGSQEPIDEFFALPDRHKVIVHAVLDEKGGSSVQTYVRGWRPAPRPGTRSPAKG